MRRATLTLVLLTIAVFAFCVEPFVSGVTAAQRTDGSQIIEIWYDVEDADSDTLTIVLEVSDDGGQTFAVVPDPANLSGDLGAGITPGTGKHIEWAIGAESVDYDSDSFVVKVSAIEPTPPIPSGMVLVPAGTFQMGRVGVAEPVHTVTLDAYWIGKYEVTIADCILFMNYVGMDISGVYNGNQCVSGINGDSGIYMSGGEFVFQGGTYNAYSNCPMICITWYGAVEYCNWRSSIDGYTPCYNVNGTSITCNWDADGYRLPTEAEWEYSARGATNTPDYTYAGSNNLDDVGWYTGNNSPFGCKPVGQKGSNGIGTKDQSGNVWEWCWDWYGSYSSSSQTNPHGPDTGSIRVLRGSSWLNNAFSCAVAYRESYQPSNVNIHIGFRVCRKF